MIYEWDKADERKAQNFYLWANSLETPEGEPDFGVSVHWDEDRTKVRIHVDHVVHPLDRSDVNDRATVVYEGKKV